MSRRDILIANNQDIMYGRPGSGFAYVHDRARSKREMSGRLVASVLPHTVCSGGFSECPLPFHFSGRNRKW